MTFSLVPGGRRNAAMLIIHHQKSAEEVNISKAACDRLERAPARMFQKIRHDMNALAGQWRRMPK